VLVVSPVTLPAVMGTQREQGRSAIGCAVVDDSREVGPWVLLGEEPRLEGFRRVVSRRYRLPSGEESDWDILAGGRSVAVVAVTEGGQVVLVRQFRAGPARVLLELPGGNVDGDEPVEDAAVRELLQETGYKASSIEVVSRTWLAAYAAQERFAVVARGCRRVAEPTPDREEFVEPVEVSMPEFVEHALAGDLTDQDVALRGLVTLGVLVLKR
jgi:ADP-ribose pyrophosphatase